MTTIETTTRARWLAERRTGIGGSDAAAILGLSPWGSPFQVWLDKTGQLDDEPPSEAMEWGLILEDVVADQFEKRTGILLERQPDIIRHKTHPWMLASIDRWAIEADGTRNVYEGKTASAFADDWDPDLDKIPDHVHIQCQHYLAVADAEVCHGAVLKGGSKFRMFAIRRDEALISDLITAEERWWRTYVEGDTPPPIDGHQATTEVIKAMYPTSTEALEVDLPPTAHQLVVDWLAAKQRKKDAGVLEAECANKLRLLLGDAAVGRINGMKAVTWKSYTRRAFEVAETTVRPLNLAKGYPVNA